MVSGPRERARRAGRRPKLSRAKVTDTQTPRGIPGETEELRAPLRGVRPAGAPPVRLLK